MKKTIITIMFVCLFVSVSFANYTYTIDTYQSLPDLFGTESMLITSQGGGGGFYANDNSSVVVEGTSPLGQGTGGIWQIELGYVASLTMSGGQVNLIDLGGDATASLSGGLIQQIWSQQYTEYWDNDNQVWVQTPHITIIYSGDLPTYNETTDVLSGLWGTGDPFSIHLVDVQGYDPAIENIRFELIPEPTTLILLGLGGLLIRRK